MHALHVIINGELIPEHEAKLGINDLSIVRGYGIFDYFKTIDNRSIFIEDNLDRFYNSARLMDLPILFSRDELKHQIQWLKDSNNIPNSGIKLLLTGGYSPDGYTIATPNLIITQHELTLNSIQEIKGLKLHLFEFHRPFALVKSIDYVMGIQALKVVKKQGADDVLYFQNNLISECPRANFFLVTEDNKLLTPGKDVLAGITRKQILEMVIGHYDIEVRDVSLQDVLAAKEAFMTSTTKNITPVTAIVGFKEFGIGAGPVTRELQSLLATRISNS